MTDPAITAFYEDDHHRLDGLLTGYRQLKGSDPKAADESLRRFRAGLEQHMAWEESLLFSEYDARVSSPDGVTEELLSDHAELLNLLDRIEEKRRERADTGAEEARLLRALAAHNASEETGLYQALDRLLNPAEREELFTRMRAAAWEEAP